jgi:uncharacterized membrane protein YqaE (UPF0057 family)
MYGTLKSVMNLNISKFIYKQGQKFNGGGNQSTQRKLAAGRWFSAGTPVSSTNKTDCQDIIEILVILCISIFRKQTFLHYLIINMMNNILLHIPVHAIYIIYLRKYMIQLGKYCK